MADSLLEFEYIWKLENCILLNPYIVSTVETPEFEIPTIPLTKWTLGYHLKEARQENCLRVFLKRSNDDDGEEEVSVKFKISISKDNHVIASNTDYATSTLFSKGYSTTTAINLTVGELMNCFKSILTARCQIFANNDETIKIREEIDLKTLSQDINNLYENKILPDVVLKTQNQAVEGHKAILWARCPQFLKYEDLVEKSDLDVVEITEQVLKTLLQYVYSGIISAYMSDTSSDICSIIQKYNITSIHRSMSAAPSKCSVHSKVHECNISYLWSIKNFERLTLNEKVCSSLLNLNTSQLTQWRLFAKLRKDNSGENVEVSLRCVYAKTLEPIYLQYKICVIQSNNEHGFCSSSNRLFYAGEEYTIPLVITKQSLTYKHNLYLPNGTLSFNCILSLSDGAVSHSTCELHIKPDDPMNKYKILSSDLNKLFMNVEFSDVELVVNDSKFSAHKAILAARSPVFSRMFQTDMSENSTNKLIIKDAEPKTIASLLAYIYTAKVELTSVIPIMELYAVADKYEILALKDKCSSYLKCYLTFENVGDVLTVADVHQDEKLKNAAQTFIYNNADKILVSDEWKTFIHTRADLACEIIHQLSIKYARKESSKVQTGSNFRSNSRYVDDSYIQSEYTYQ